MVSGHICAQGSDDEFSPRLSSHTLIRRKHKNVKSAWLWATLEGEEQQSGEWGETLDPKDWLLQITTLLQTIQYTVHSLLYNISQPCWMNMTFCTDIHGPQKNPNNFSLNFRLAPSSGQNFNLSNTLVYDQIPAKLKTCVKMLTCWTKMDMVDVLNIIPAKHQRVIIVIVCMLAHRY